MLTCPIALIHQESIQLEPQRNKAGETWREDIVYAKTTTNFTPAERRLWPKLVQALHESDQGHVRNG
jgi:hypothetical protein